MNNWKVPSYTRRDGNKVCWVVEDKPRPKSICRCFGPKGEEHAEFIVLACNSYKDLVDAGKAMVTDFDLGEHCVKHSLAMMRAAIKKACPDG